MKNKLHLLLIAALCCAAPYAVSMGDDSTQHDEEFRDNTTCPAGHPAHYMSGLGYYICMKCPGYKVVFCPTCRTSCRTTQSTYHHCRPIAPTNNSYWVAGSTPVEPTSGYQAILADEFYEQPEVDPAQAAHVHNIWSQASQPAPHSQPHNPPTQNDDEQDLTIRRFQWDSTPSNSISKYSDEPDEDTSDIERGRDNNDRQFDNQQPFYPHRHGPGHSTHQARRAYSTKKIALGALGVAVAGGALYGANKLLTRKSADDAQSNRPTKPGLFSRATAFVTKTVKKHAGLGIFALISGGTYLGLRATKTNLSNNMHNGLRAIGQTNLLEKSVGRFLCNKKAINAGLSICGGALAATAYKLINNRKKKTAQLETESTN